MSSYKDILKSTGLIAVVQVLQLLFALIRNKAVAIVAGASGFGIWSLYQTYIELVTSFSTLGIEQSGVREMSKHDDTKKVHRSIFIFEILIVTTSAIAALLSIAFSSTVSESLFQTQEHSNGIKIVSVAIFCGSIFKGQKSILNGLRDLKGLAKSQIIGSSIGSLLTLALVFKYKAAGIPIYLVIISLSSLAATWWFKIKLQVQKETPTVTEFITESKTLLSIGLGFCATAAIGAIMTYFARVYLSKSFDLQTVGIYQASWTISNLYIGIILSAMGVDFMPRLMKVVNDNSELNKLVNEQMELGSLISSIGIVIVILFSGLILSVLYSNEFSIGKDIIQWQILGVSLRIIGFPFSHSIMAKNKPTLYIIIQAIFWVGDYVLLIIFSKIFGFNGLGMNYPIAYSLYLLGAWIICKKLFDFKMSKLLKKILTISFLFTISSWLAAFFLSGYILYATGVFIICSMSIWIYTYLKKHMNLSFSKILKRK